MHIGILTGGGDVPGLNPCIRALTLSALERGWTVTGFRRGWEGVLGVDPDDLIGPHQPVGLSPDPHVHQAHANLLCRPCFTS